MKGAPGAPGRHDLNIRAPGGLLKVSALSRAISVSDASLSLLSSVCFHAHLLHPFPECRKQVIRSSHWLDIFPDSSGHLEQRSNSWTWPPKPGLMAAPALLAPCSSTAPFFSLAVLPAILLGFHGHVLLLAIGAYHPCPSFGLPLSAPPCLATHPPSSGLCRHISSPGAASLHTGAPVPGGPHGTLSY